MENEASTTERPQILVSDYNATVNYNKYTPLSILTKNDQLFLNFWREKQRRLYKKYTSQYNENDEKYLIDPDPFEAKWYIFRIKSKSRRATPAPSPYFPAADEEIYPNNQDLLPKFTLNP